MKRETSIVLGKLLAAIAWADGEIQYQEIEQLKRWFSMQKELGQKDWFLIRLYLEYPLTKGEIESVIDQVGSVEFDDDERSTVLSWVKKIIEADDVVDENEKLLYKQVQAILEPNNDKMTRTPFRLLKARLTSQSVKKPTILGRDRHLDDFWENPIFFRFYRSVQESDVFVSVDKETLRKVCYAASLLIIVAQADDKVHGDEMVAMGKALNQYFEIPNNLSKAILDRGSELEKEMFNTQRICRKFLEVISKNDTLSFISPLSEIIWADGKILPIEKKVFQDIAQNLKVPAELIQKQIKIIEDMEADLLENEEEVTAKIKSGIEETKKDQKIGKGSIAWPPKNEVN